MAGGTLVKYLLLPRSPPSLLLCLLLDPCPGHFRRQRELKKKKKKKKKRKLSPSIRKIHFFKHVFKILSLKYLTVNSQIFLDGLSVP